MEKKLQSAIQEKMIIHQEQSESRKKSKDTADYSTYLYNKENGVWILVRYMFYYT